MAAQLLNTDEVAQMLGVLPATVTRWARCGELRGAKIGKGWYFSAEQIARRVNREESLREAVRRLRG